MKFILNGRTRKASEGMTVLEASREARVEIPALCAHEALEPYGGCRLCIVEVRPRGSRKWRIVASCLYPVSEGLEVRTNTERIDRLRRFLLELLLARSPSSLFVKEFAYRYGVSKTRFAKVGDNCILCGLCVRTCSEIVGSNAIGFSGRGIDRKVEPPYGYDRSRCIACGACTYVCPTGAVQMEHERVEELRKLESEHPCRYTLMGFVGDAVCSLNYECFRCEIDQRFRIEAGMHPIFAKINSKRERKKR